MERVLAIAEHLKTEGKYSDGVNKSEQHLPPRPRHPAPLRRLRQRRAHGRQRRAVRRGDGADRQRDRRPGARGDGRRRPRGRRGHRRGRRRPGSSSGSPTARGAPCRPSSSCPTSRRPSSSPRPTPRSAARSCPRRRRSRRPPTPATRATPTCKERKANKDGGQEGALAGAHARLGRHRGHLRRHPAAGHRRGPRRHHRRQGAAPSSAPQRRDGLDALRRRLARARRPRPRPRPAGAARSTITRREQSGSIGSERRRAGPRGRQLRLRAERAGGRRAAATYWDPSTSERKAMSHAVGRRRRWLAAVNLASLRLQDDDVGGQ